MANQETVEIYSQKINQRWDLFFQIRFITLKKYTKKNPTGNPNCPGKYGLQRIFCSGANERICSECKQSEFNMTFTHLCESCRYEICNSCYQNKSIS